MKNQIKIKKTKKRAEKAILENNTVRKYYY